MGLFTGLVLRKLANDYWDRKYLEGEEDEQQEFYARLITKWLSTPEGERDVPINDGLVMHRVLHPATFDKALATLPPGPGGADTASTGHMVIWVGAVVLENPTLEGHASTGWVSLGRGHRARASWVETADGTRWVLPPRATDAVRAALGTRAEGIVGLTFDPEKGMGADQPYTAIALDS